MWAGEMERRRDFVGFSVVVFVFGLGFVSAGAQAVRGRREDIIVRMAMVRRCILGEVPGAQWIQSIRNVLEDAWKDARNAWQQMLYMIRAIVLPVLWGANPTKVTHAH